MTPPSPAASDRDAVFSTRVAITISAVAAVSFLIALIVIGHSDDARQSLTAAPSGFSMSALGYSGAADFLRDSGIAVRMRRGRRSLRAESAAVFLAEPELNPRLTAVQRPMDLVSPEDTELERDRRDNVLTLARLARDQNAPLVLVLPKWRAKQALTLKGLWVHEAELRSLDVCAEPMLLLTGNDIDAAALDRRAGLTPRTLPCKTAWGTPTAELVSPQWLLPGSGIEPVVSTPDGILIARVSSTRGRPIYVISDPDLLNNHGLARADNAEILLRFLKDDLHVSTVVLDEVSHGLQQETPFLAEFVRRPLVYVSLQSLAVFGLMFWAGAVRFGRALPMPPRLAPGKTTLIENTAQLLSHRARFQQSASRYFDDVVAEVAHSYHLDAGKPAEILKDLQRLTKQRRIEVSLADLRSTLKPEHRRRGGSFSQLLDAAHALHDWREGMLNGR